MKQIPGTLAAGLILCASVAWGGEAPGAAAGESRPKAASAESSGTAEAPAESASPGRAGGLRPEGEPVPRPGRHAPDEVDVRLIQGADLTFPELLRAGGRASYALLVLSLAVVAAALYCAIECRRGRILPRDLHEGVTAQLAAGDRAGALSGVEGGASLYARGAAAALSQDEGAPPDELRALLRASGERDAATLRRRLAIVPKLGALAALVGLVGTLVGMIQAFGIAARGVYEPVLADAAVFKALITGLFGVALGVVALPVYFVLSAGLARALAEAAFAFEELAAAARRGSSRPDARGATGISAGDDPGASSERGPR
ncbi:MAG: MotA/TolQ/ExbB proton channel family protein [Planctomycetota bacterium]